MQKANSPTARLLRNSKLFALPRDLPDPRFQLINTYRSPKPSATGTAPYPTQQAITAPYASRRNGEWGLKRPLPSKASASSFSHPTVRINAQDSREQITDYESANDHVRTLQKWQEMDTPFLQIRRGSFHLQQSVMSVFDEKFDKRVQRSPAMVKEGKDPLGPSIWRGAGIENMNEQQFHNYVTHNIRSRKGAFKKFLTRYFKEQKLRKQRGSVTGSFSEEEIAEVEMSPDEVRHRMKLLRNEADAFSPLLRLVRQFLELPPPRIDDASAREMLSLTDPSVLEPNAMAYTTHPSAGLHYKRSAAHATNHPLLGPQVHDHPVPARRLLSNDLADPMIRYGVGGVVVQPKASQLHGRPGSRWARDDNFKTVTKATHATITPEGEINLQVDLNSTDVLRHLDAYAKRQLPQPGQKEENVEEETSAVEAMGEADMATSSSPMALNGDARQANWNMRQALDRIVSRGREQAQAGVEEQMNENAQIMQEMEEEQQALMEEEVVDEEEDERRRR